MGAALVGWGLIIGPRAARPRSVAALRRFRLKPIVALRPSEDHL